MHSEDDLQRIVLLLNFSGMILFYKSYIVSYFQVHYLLNSNYMYLTGESNNTKLC
jgi:hypothetical protein